jgi:hypothetical protein
MDGQKSAKTILNSLEAVARQLFFGGALLIVTAVPVVLVWAFFQFLGPVSDFPQYYSAARCSISGQASSAYSTAELGKLQHELFEGMGLRTVGFYLPPPALLFMAPLALFPVKIAAGVWIGLQVCALIISAFVLTRLWPRSRRYYTAFWSCVLLSGPFYEALRLGQPSPLLTLSLIATMFFWQTERPVAAAICLTPFAMKPHLIIPVLIFLVGAGRYKQCVWAAGLLLLTAVMALLIYGPEIYFSYLQAVQQALNTPSNNLMASMAADLNPTIRGQLLRVPGLSKNLVSAGAIVCWAATLIYIFRSAKKLAGRRLFIENMALLCLPLTLISAFHCHDYDLLLLIPALVALDRLQQEAPPRFKLVSRARILFMAAFCLPVFLFWHYEWLLSMRMPANPLFLSMLLFCLSIIICLTGFEKKSEGSNTGGGQDGDQK